MIFKILIVFIAFISNISYSSIDEFSDFVEANRLDNNEMLERHLIMLNKLDQFHYDYFEEIERCEKDGSILKIRKCLRKKIKGIDEILLQSNDEILFANHLANSNDYDSFNEYYNAIKELIPKNISDKEMSVIRNFKNTLIKQGIEQSTEILSESSNSRFRITDPDEFFAYVVVTYSSMDIIMGMMKNHPIFKEDVI